MALVKPGFQFQSKPNINNKVYQTPSDDSNNIEHSLKSALSSIKNLKKELEELKNQQEVLLSTVVPKLITDLLEVKIERIIEERRLSDAYTLQTSIQNRDNSYSKDEIIKMIKSKGDIVYTNTYIESIFPMILKIR